MTASRKNNKRLSKRRKKCKKSHTQAVSDIMKRALSRTRFLGIPRIISPDPMPHIKPMTRKFKPRCSRSKYALKHINEVTVQLNDRSEKADIVYVRPKKILIEKPRTRMQTDDSDNNAESLKDILKLAEYCRSALKRLSIC